MKRFVLAAALFAFTTALPAQNTAPAAQPPTSAATPQPMTQPASKPGKAPMQQAPGGGPDQVWVNTTSSVYHCPGDRYYGKTAHGRYMTEAAAKSAGAKGQGGKTCFAGK